MDGGSIKEEPKNRIRPVVIMGSDTNHQSTLAINESMDHDLPPNQT
jgi:hypothetical protein